jgi:hypothetical protein
LSKSEWNQIINQSDRTISTELISNVPHGFKTRPPIGSKSLYYNPPFFIKLKTPLITDANYLVFKGRYEPNNMNCILAMTTFNEDIDMFQTEFTSSLEFSYTKMLMLNQTLEFIIVDSDNNIIDIEDGCQLFFSISVY